MSSTKTVIMLGLVASAAFVVTQVPAKDVVAFITETGAQIDTAARAGMVSYAAQTASREVGNAKTVPYRETGRVRAPLPAGAESYQVTMAPVVLPPSADTGVVIKVPVAPREDSNIDWESALEANRPGYLAQIRAQEATWAVLQN